jgi:hypothetical protein
MDTSPAKKYGSELSQLKKVNVKDLQVGKFYYIRFRNKDKSADIWGTNEDFIGKINNVSSEGVSFDFTYKRNADPRHGAFLWKKAPEYNRVIILAESLKHKNMNDNTTFYIHDVHPPVRKTKASRANVL